MEQPLPMTLEPNYFDSMDSITAHYFAHISDLKKKKKIFKKKLSKPGNGNLALITSTVQVELSKLNKF